MGFTVFVFPHVHFARPRLLHGARTAAGPCINAWTNMVDTVACFQHERTLC